MNIVIANRQRTKRINPRRLKQIIQAILAELNITSAELGVHLVGAKEMARVNWEYLQHEGSTDVITFNHHEPISKPQPPDMCPRIYGELFVSVDDAISQAREFKTNWQSETVRYVVHGILHLLGHDDLKPDLRRKMRREENRMVLALAKKFSFTQLSRAAKLRA